MHSRHSNPVLHSRRVRRAAGHVGRRSLIVMAAAIMTVFLGAPGRPNLHATMANVSARGAVARLKTLKTLNAFKGRVLAIAVGRRFRPQTRNAEGTGGTSALQINVHDVNPGPSVPRDQCLTIAVSANIAYQCSDLRISHPLPSTTTMGQTFTPQLVTVWHNVEMIATDVSVPSGTQVDSLQARVINPMNGLFFGPTTYAGGPQWSTGATRRISVPMSVWNLDIFPYGAYRYRVEVTAFTPNGPVTAVDSGVIATTNRVTSPFGYLWWLDGLERLSFYAPSPNQILWLGGDNSTRLYTKAADRNTWFVTPAIDRPDSMTFDGTTYRRYLRSGARTEFSAAGLHMATVNSKGHRTQFFYTGDLLDSIALPVPTGGTPRVYAFKYHLGPTYWQLDTVIAPNVGGVARRVAIVDSIGEYNLPHVIAITDPDTLSTRFDYQALSLKGRTDKNGVRTSFDFYWTMLERATLHMNGTGDDIVHTFCAAEWIGYASCAPLAVLVDSVRTLVDGPRADIDVRDTTAFYLDRFGAPKKIVNALGQTTVIERNDTRWPLAATALVENNGYRVEATYDTLGLISTRREVDPYGDNRFPLTRYFWNRFDKPDSTIAPSGEKMRFGYLTNGDRAWQEDGRGLVSRDSLTYNANRQLQSFRPAGNSDSQTDRIFYDAALGNLSQTVSPRNFTVDHFRDAIGRDTLTITPTDSLQTAGYRQRTRTIYTIMDLVDSTVTVGAAIPYALRSTDTYTAPVTADTLVTKHTYDNEGNRTSTVVTPSLSPNAAGDIEAQLQSRDFWTYDGADRVTVHSVNGRIGFTNAVVNDSTFYDPAGNVVRVATPSGGGYTQQFDALNRLSRRIVQSRAYPQQRCEGFLVGAVTDPGNIMQCLTVFPMYYNTATGYGYATPLDTATFAYDAAGNMVQADNVDARVRRGYYPNGALKVDSTSYRSVAGSAFTHLSIVSHHYDLSGRRDVITLPTAQSIPYTYRSDNGALATVSDPFNNAYRYTYDPAGRIDSIVVGTGAVREHRHYDADGRQDTRERVSASLGQLSREQLTFDAQGRVRRAAYSTLSNAVTDDTTFFAYSGLGAVLARERITAASNWETEEFRVDALGNVLRTRSEFRDDADNMPQASIFHKRGALVHRTADDNPNYPLEHDELLQQLDLDGHTILSHHLARDRSNAVITDTPSRSYYGADGKLRAVQRYNLIPGTGQAGTWDEYRYDGLGRRVMVIARPGLSTDDNSACSTISPQPCASLCTVSGCAAKVTWALYDGDQLLQEERRAYANGSDFGDVSPPSYGTVQYIHGLELDKPLALIDANAGVHVLNANWRGLFETSVTPSGAAADCSLITDGSSCQQIAWPKSLAVYSRPAPVAGVGSTSYTWMGSLVTDQQDGTEHLFRRNRYFDPDVGRFTQEDPIGLAGGMNLYGFAGGDPVNLSDPFGLCPPADKDDGPQCRVKFWGVGLDAVLGYGVNAAVGVSYSADEGLGVYARGGVQAGLDVNVFGEVGMSKNRAAFEGKSIEGCAGAWGGSLCVSTNNSGLTGSGSFGVGTKDLGPVSVHAGAAYAKSYTWKDLKNVGGKMVGRLESNILQWVGYPP